MSSVIASQRWSNLSEYLTLTAPIDANDTSISVDDVSDLYAITGSEYLVASLGDSKTGEIIHIYALPGGNVCYVTRGQEGSTAQAWDSGTVVNIRVTAGSLNAIVQALGAVEDAVVAQEEVPAFSVVFSETNQEVADATPIAVAFEMELYQTHSMHDTVTNNSRLVAPITGTYMVSGFVEFEANATGYRELSVRKGGSAIQVLNRVGNLGGVVTTPVFVDTPVYLAEDEYVELIANHTAGGPIDIVAGNGGPKFNIRLIRGHGALGGGT